MSVKRLDLIPGFSIDQVAKAAGNDPDVLRLENLDTDLNPPKEAIAATKLAVDKDDNNSYLPFIGHKNLRSAIANHIYEYSKIKYNPNSEIIVTAGGTEAMFDVLLSVTDPGDEVIVTDPTYAGIINRVRLAGAKPVFVRYFIENNKWKLDVSQLDKLYSSKTKAIFIMNPSMPSGAVLTVEDWNSIAEFCVKHSIWLIYNAAMERILYDNLSVIHPASFNGMRDRTIIIGSVSKEFRMIGWRIGWVAAPDNLITDLAKVHIYNVVTPTGISQDAAVAALRAPKEDFLKCLYEWEKRRNILLEQLADYPVVYPEGGWSALLNVSEMGYNSETASKKMLEFGKIAATPMKHWGDKNSDQFVRLVFSNEPANRLAQLSRRLKRVF